MDSSAQEALSALILPGSYRSSRFLLLFPPRGLHHPSIHNGYERNLRLALRRAGQFPEDHRGRRPETPQDNSKHKHGHLSDLCTDPHRGPWAGHSPHDHTHEGECRYIFQGRVAVAQPDTTGGVHLAVEVVF